MSPIHSWGNSSKNLNSILAQCELTRYSREYTRQNVKAISWRYKWVWNTLIFSVSIISDRCLYGSGLRTCFSVGVICDCFRALKKSNYKKKLIDISDNFLFCQKDCSYWITSACQMSLAHFFEISPLWNQIIVGHTSSKTKYCYWYNSRNSYLKTLN